MKVVLRTPTQLVVHEGALRTVAVGTVFLALGGAAMVLRIAEPTGWTGNAGAWLVYLVGGLFVAVGLASLGLSADRHVFIDRSAGTVNLVVRRLSHRRSDQYRLEDLKDVALERSPDHANQPGQTYRVVFLTRGGGRVPWTPYSVSDDGELASCASVVRAFCGWATPQPAADAKTEGRVSGHPLATNWGLVGSMLGIFAAAGLGLFGSELYRVFAWQPVSARVLATDLRAVHGDKGTTYGPVVRYRYSINGTAYESDRVLPLNLSASYEWAERIRSRFRPGDLVIAYANPRRPGDAFLVRKVSLLPLLFVGFPLAFVGLLAAIAGAQRRRLALRQRYPVPVVEWAQTPAN